MKGLVGVIGTRNFAREQQRLARERRLELERSQADAQAQVQDFEQLLKLLTQGYETPPQPFDWQAFLLENQPTKPFKTNPKTEQAQQALEAYKPSLIGGILGRDKKKKNELETALETAQAEDEAAYQNSLQSYQLELEEYQALEKQIRQIQTQIQDPDKLPALAYMHLLDRFEILDLSLDFKRNAQGQALLQIKDFDLNNLPKEKLSLDAEAKLVCEPLEETEKNQLAKDIILNLSLLLSRQWHFHFSQDTSLNIEVYLSNGACCWKLQTQTQDWQKLENQNFDPLQAFPHQHNWSKNQGLAPLS